MKSILLILSVLFLSSCSKKDEKKFCDRSREAVEVISNRPARVVKPTSFDYYELDVTPNPDGDIYFDTQVLGVVCELPEEFKVDGREVIVSGTLKKMYKDEFPELPVGTSMYFLKISSVSQRP